MPTTAESVAAAFGLLWFWSAGRAIEECDSATTIEQNRQRTYLRPRYCAVIAGILLIVAAVRITIQSTVRRSTTGSRAMRNHNYLLG